MILKFFNMSDNFDFPVVQGLSSSLFVCNRPIDVMTHFVDCVGATHFISDVNLLLNAERIKNTLGEETYLNIVRSISPSNSPYKRKLPDDDLISTIKPRYLQSPAEVASWIYSLEDKYQDLVAEFRSKFDESKPDVDDLSVSESVSQPNND